VGVQHLRHEAGADALDRVRALGAFGEHRRCLRLHGDRLETGLAFLDDFGHAGDGAAGADAGHQDVDLAVGVAPDFLGRRAAVDFGVGRIVELLRHEAMRIRGDDFLGAADRTQHALRTGSKH
jgi:hypothetical protein